MVCFIHWLFQSASGHHFDTAMWLFGVYVSKFSVDINKFRYQWMLAVI